ncbi:hypothetical protein [Candidatus Regiella insecticola]|uniref:hypothetical protein n=1 Tax=Candidatus Regiella insecticola TaxID=138073 RepID=UPI000586640B|nr:hypothetical protein [Candidatus Regiella insecticola]
MAYLIIKEKSKMPLSSPSSPPISSQYNIPICPPPSSEGQSSSQLLAGLQHVDNIPSDLTSISLAPSNMSREIPSKIIQIDSTQTYSQHCTVVASTAHYRRLPDLGKDVLDFLNNGDKEPLDLSDLYYDFSQQEEPQTPPPILFSRLA